MSEIVKTCKTHGDLVESECRVRNRKLADGSPVKRYECKQCAADAKRAWAKKNPDKTRQYKFKDWPTIVGDGPIKCVTCRKEKPQDEFHKHMLKNSNPRCRPCMMASLKKYKKNNREKYNATQKANREKRKDVISKTTHRSKLRIYYDMTEEEYNHLLHLQNNVCAICQKHETRKHPNGTISRLCVDHCHETGVIRGLLCNLCNLTIKKGDTPDFYRAIVKYLEGPGYKRP